MFLFILKFIIDIKNFHFHTYLDQNKLEVPIYGTFIQEGQQFL